MHRRRHNVIRRLIPQLHNEFAQVRLEHLDALFFERWREMNFLRHHGFRFHDGAHAATCSQLQNVTPRFVCALGPKYLPAALLHVPLEILQIAIEMIHRLALDALAFLARRLPIEKAHAAIAHRRVVMINSAPQNLAMNQVGGLHRRAA